MKVQLTDKISWVGKVDWELRKFHGQEYSTHRGSTYNSYLVQDAKTVLIDSVWQPFAEEFVENLKTEISLNDIDFVIANHAEIDHSGALDLLMKEIPDTPVYCTNNGLKSFKGHFHKDWSFVPVKTGDTLDMGTNQLTFIEAPMLHWPDSMFCYLDGENVLFSNDAFGQHYATELLYNDAVDQAELFQECIKYYANILTPFSKLVARKINEFAGLNLPVEMIRGLGFAGKKAAAFGAYGWSGESIKMISEKLDEAGFTVLNDGIRCRWNPDSDALKECVQFGKKFRETI